MEAGKMMGKRMHVEWREEDTEEALKAAYQAERDGIVRTRLHALWLLRRDWRAAEVADALGAGYRSVKQWVMWYRRGGLDEVRVHKKGGKGTPRFLNAHQERALVEEVKGGRFRTAAQIRDWIESEYGVEYAVKSVYTVLRRLGCARKVPRPRHTKADVARQEAWKRGGLGEALADAGVTEGTALGFADEMRVGLRGMVREVWGVRGVKVVQPVQVSYKWTYLFLVVDGQRGKVSWTWMESMKTEDIAPAVREVAQDSEVGAVVWDGASGHSSDDAKSTGLATVIQPPYSPELNPAERVFQEARRDVEGVVYASISEKKKAVDESLRGLASDPDRVRSLAGWGWIADNLRSLGMPRAA